MDVDCLASNVGLWCSLQARLSQRRGKSILSVAFGHAQWHKCNTDATWRARPGHCSPLANRRKSLSDLRKSISDPINERRLEPTGGRRTARGYTQTETIGAEVSVVVALSRCVHQKRRKKNDLLLANKSKTTHLSCRTCRSGLSPESIAGTLWPA